METVVAPRVVHESEVQRQHPRVRLPGSVTLDGGSQRLRLHDISVGGLSFIDPKGRYRVGKVHRVMIHIALRPIQIALPVAAEVRHRDPHSGMVGCSFQNPGPHEVSVLRQLVSARLSGELIEVGDVLLTLSRDNFVSARPEQVSSATARGRAVLMTAIIFIVGILAFGYAASKIYAVAFVKQAVAAKVAAPSFTMNMPRDGTYFSLVKPGDKVTKGQAIGSFQAAMLDVVRSDPGSLHLTPDQLSQLMGQTLKGTITSPCNCVVESTYALDSQFINRNQPLMQLVPEQTTPHVVARFHFADIDELSAGRRVEFHVVGGKGSHSGVISDVRLMPTPVDPNTAGSSDLRGLNASGAANDVLVDIQPSQPLQTAQIDRPVIVQLSSAAWSWLSADRLGNEVKSTAAKVKSTVDAVKSTVDAVTQDASPQPTQ